MIANLITQSRLVAVALVLVAAALGMPETCLGLLAYAALTDAVDGRLARALGQESERGARLDSMADCALCMTAPFVLLEILPWLRRQETPAMLVILVAYAVPVAFGAVKYGRLTSYHTTAARSAGVLITLTFLVLLITRVAWPFHLAAGLVVISAIEEVCITFVLPEWRASVPSLRHALRMGGATAAPAFLSRRES